MAWFITQIGFFSVVNKTGNSLTCRSRCLKDIQKLQAEYLPSIKIQHTPDNDYPYRAVISHTDFAKALSEIVMDIDYPNFKGVIGETVGLSREYIYSKVWGTLLELQAVDGR